MVLAVGRGLRIAENSLVLSSSFSRMSEVAELFMTSMSSATMMSARVPASWLVMPRDMTEGDWSGSAGPTSNMSLDDRWLSLGFK